MKTFFFVLILCIEWFAVPAQKQPLDYAAIDNWPHLENEKISDDGRYILYNISTKKEGTTLIIQSIANSSKVNIVGGRDALFTGDNKRVIFKTASDSLSIVELEKGNIHVIDKIIFFKSPLTGDGRWLVYQKMDSAKEFVLLDFFNGEKRIFQYILDFQIFDDSKQILIHQSVTRNNAKLDSVTRVDLTNGESHFICLGNGAFDWVMDKTGSQIAFLKTSTNSKRNEIWYYKTGMGNPILYVNDSTEGIQGFTIAQDRMFFSPDGNNIFFKIQTYVESHLEDSLKNHDQYIIWSYRDDLLNSSSQIPITYLEAVINLRSPKKVVIIEKKRGERSFSSSWGCYSNDKVLLLANLVGREWESRWRASARPDLYFVSTENGTKKLLCKNCYVPSTEVGFSPNGTYVFWFERSKKHWFTYNLRTGITKNISLPISPSLVDIDREIAGDLPSYGMAGWFENDSAIFLQDKFDIWEVDPDRIKPPRNITLGYGRRHHTILRPVEFNASELASPGDQWPSFTSKDTLTLFTCDSVSKLNGFAQVPLNGRSGPVILANGPMNYYGVIQALGAGDPSLSFCLKAKYANTFILKPSRDTVYPNLCFTKDFTHFYPLTGLAPQKKYNWYTDELIHWKEPSGRINTGILFKPEDFDPHRKYPLIVFIYETFSDGLNVFLTPELCKGDLEILWYISHDYLVLVPDIHYIIGHPGQSAYNSVVSGVHYLSTEPWVDARRLGLQGHSFGGYETNYIITRTHLFAAACSANGVSNVISESGQLLDRNTGYQGFFELGQGRMGTTLWERPDLYIHESPIFSADKVTTPLLIMHNPLDNSVYFSQAVEWFTGLRRLGKKAWMLQYPNEEHIIWEEPNQLDYSIRLNQFFDHYLKGAPSPKWMTEGGTSLELDTSGRQP